MNGVLGITLAVLAPVILVILVAVAAARKAKKKRAEELLSALDQLVREKHLAIASQDILAHKILALDAGQRLLVYIRHHEGIAHQIVPLDAVTDCRLKYSGTVIREAKKNGLQVSEEHVTEVALTLTLRDGTVIDLPIYNEIQDGAAEKLPLIRTGEQWQETIRQHLNQQIPPARRTLIVSSENV